MMNLLGHLRNFRKAGVALGLCTLAIAGTPAAQSQTYSVVFSFSGPSTGLYPVSGVTVDRAGNLYGTTQIGGPGTNCYEGCGTVFKLSRHGSGWVFTPLHSFVGGTDGGNPSARPVFAPDGSLWGTTTEGGVGCFGMGCGTVYQLQPPQHATGNILGGWLETVIYRFNDSGDGNMPEDADLLFDASGNVYGSTFTGGDGSQCFGGCGTVYKLTHSNGAWTESIIHNFGNGSDGQYPWTGLIFDRSGNLYGTTSSGGANRKGAIYQLVPSANGWTEQVIYSFQNMDDGYISYGGLIADAAGNFYGTTCCGGPLGGGAAFQLTHSGGWVLTTLHNFQGQGPEGSLVMDAAGNLYGSTNGGGAYGKGTVFKLSPSGGDWTYTTLYDFCPSDFPCPDGAFPSGSLAIDSAGNLYGTTTDGGATGGGLVFEVTP